MQVAAQHPLEAMRRVCDTEAARNRATGSKTSTGGLERSEPRTAGAQRVALPQLLISSAGMAELADAADSKSAGLRPLGVRLPLPAPANQRLALQNPPGLAWSHFSRNGTV